MRRRPIMRAAVVGAGGEEEAELAAVAGAIPLRDRNAKARSFTLADEWIHAKELVAIGLLAVAEHDSAGAEA